MPRPHQVIVLCVLTLLMLGVVMVNSADVAVKTVTADAPIAQATTIGNMLTSRAVVYAGLAIVAMMIASMLPVRRLAWVAESGRSLMGQRGGIGNWVGLPGMFVACVCLVIFCGLVYVPGLGKEVNGSHRWINLPGAGDALGFQPSEVAKWSLVGLIAWYCARRREHIHKFWFGLTPALVTIGMVSGFIVVEDLGTGVLVAGVASLVLLAGGAKFWHFVVLMPVPVAGVFFAILTSDYRMKRIMAFLNPYEDSEGIGYHSVQSLVAIAGGGVTGKGLGGGIQKLGYLPEDRTDFIFAVICEELGVPGAAIIVVLFATLLWAGYLIIRREQSSVLRLFTLGVLATVGLQAVINLFVVTAMAPTKGIALPLISYGGTGWILTALCLGLVVAVGRSQEEDVPLGLLPEVTRSEASAA